jgi:uncharacterized cupin superfamily protein
VSFVFNLLELELDPHGMEGAPPGHEFTGASLTPRVGAALTGLGVYELPPGQSAWPYHFELSEEEWLIVLAGELVLRTPDGERTLRVGDVTCFQAGADGAHAVRNAGDVAARFAMPSAAPGRVDVAVYPDSGKIKVSGRGFERRFGLGAEREYWEGES